MEKYLQRLPRHLSEARRQFQEFKERVWERLAGRKNDFTTEIELKKRLEPRTSFDQELKFNRDRDRFRGLSAFR